MGTKNIKVPIELHTQLKIEALLQGVSLQDFVTDVLYEKLDSVKYTDEDGKPINMSNDSQVFLDRFGGVIPADSDMSFREYVEYVKNKEGILRPHDEGE